MGFLESLPPAVALALGLFLLVWLVLLFLLPFMVENIRGWARRIHGELEQLNTNVARLNRLLGDGIGAPPASRAEPRERQAERPERGEPSAARARKEPTISDLPPIQEPARRPPPNPAARR